jgi:hypothetical protein
MKKYLSIHQPNELDAFECEIEYRSSFFCSEATVINGPNPATHNKGSILTCLPQLGHFRIGLW